MKKFISICFSFLLFFQSSVVFAASEKEMVIQDFLDLTSKESSYSFTFDERIEYGDDEVFVLTGDLQKQGMRYRGKADASFRFNQAYYQPGLDVVLTGQSRFQFFADRDDLKYAIKMQSHSFDIDIKDQQGIENVEFLNELLKIVRNNWYAIDGDELQVLWSIPDEDWQFSSVEDQQHVTKTVLLSKMFTMKKKGSSFVFSLNKEMTAQDIFDTTEKIEQFIDPKNSRPVAITPDQYDAQELNDSLSRILPLLDMSLSFHYSGDEISSIEQVYLIRSSEISALLKDIRLTGKFIINNTKQTVSDPVDMIDMVVFLKALEQKKQKDWEQRKQKEFNEEQWFKPFTESLEKNGVFQESKSVEVIPENDYSSYDNEYITDGIEDLSEALEGEIYSIDEIIRLSEMSYAEKHGLDPSELTLPEPDYLNNGRWSIPEDLQRNDEWYAEYGRKLYSAWVINYGSPAGKVYQSDLAEMLEAVNIYSHGLDREDDSYALSKMDVLITVLRAKGVRDNYVQKAQELGIVGSDFSVSDAQNTQASRAVLFKIFYLTFK
ncbi:hypothetical protein COB57_02110 [Candidatus Peregrinibacteria bacterium]|nr:MAG: hypothetical protein COB57_02110 [Candidatus Peregrinibacteria bacterium]